MLTKDRLNARVRDQRLILEAMNHGVEGAAELASGMLRVVRESSGETYAVLLQSWLGVGEGMRLLPFFRDAITSRLVFAPVSGDAVARREHLVATAQRLREENPYPTYEAFRARMEQELSSPFEEIEALLYADLEDFRIIKSCAVETVSDVFKAYHARQLELMIDHASKILMSPSAKGRRFNGGEEMPCGDGKKLLAELGGRKGEWTLAITLKFSGKDRTCLFSPSEYPLALTPESLMGQGEALNRPTEI